MFLTLYCFRCLIRQIALKGKEHGKTDIPDYLRRVPHWAAASLRRGRKNRTIRAGFSEAGR